MSRAAISHVVMFCFDFKKQLDFYTRVVGFKLSDIGHARGNDICFLTLDPDEDHHQLALCSGRKGAADGGPLNHIAFRVDTLDALRERFKQLSNSPDVSSTETVSHGSWLSVYYRDSENNRMEFFFDTPWYVRQPIVDTLDLTKSNQEILGELEAKYKDTDGFELMKTWQAKKSAELSNAV